MQFLEWWCSSPLLGNSFNKVVFTLIHYKRCASMISRGKTLLNLQIPWFKKKARKDFRPLSAMYGIGYFQNFGNFLGIFVLGGGFFGNSFRNSWFFGEFDNSLGILWEFSMIVYIFKVNFFLTFSKPADCLHLQSQLIVYIVKISWFWHSKSQLITKSYLNMEGIDFLS